MKTRYQYPIKYVSLQTGLKPHLIRSWEERYDAICPQRSSSNRRIYSDSDIKRLKLLKMAVRAGQNISSVASLSDEDLKKLVGRSNGSQSGSYPAPNIDAEGYSDKESQTWQQTVDLALNHILRLDSLQLEHTLNDAAIHMTRQTFLQHIILPLFQRIGDLWSNGDLKIINEHMASVIVRSLLWDMLRSVIVSENAPKMVVATPVGHWHEFGALASSLAASESGWRVLYFGPNLPSEEMAYAVKKFGAKAITLSLCHRLNDHQLAAELRKLRRLLGSRLPIFIGGAGALAAQKTIEAIGAVVVNDLRLFRDKLESLIEDNMV